MTFQRIEKKYRITVGMREKLLAEIGSRLCPDVHGKSTVCSLYLDTADYLLIRRSIDADTYKEKLRLRSYGIPREDGTVFLEIKKKYDGVVYKRRESMTLAEARRYLYEGVKPADTQIMREIDWAMRFYGNPKPRVLLCYEREAFTVPGYPALRLTFDSGVRYRCDKLLFEENTDGTRILPEDEMLFEVKTDAALPIWLIRAMEKCGVKPAKFSKYGTAFCKIAHPELSNRNRESMNENQIERNIVS